MLEREQIDFLLAKAYNAAIKAGAKIIEIYTQYEDFYVSLKSDSTPITIADKEAHTIIKHTLATTRIPVLSEEGRDIFYEERQSWDLFWLVDPLDGTDEFIKRNGEFTVNIALMVDNRPCFGVIYIPTSRTIYFSDPDRGAFCKTDIEPEIISEQTISEIFAGAHKLPAVEGANSPVKVVLSRSHESAFASEFLDYIKNRVGELQIIEYGSSLKFCLIADGNADFYIRTTPTMEWDTAAGEAIATAAGVVIETINGNIGLAYNKEDLENPPFTCRTKHFK